VRRVEFVSDRLLFIVLRGRWRNIIVVNVHAPSKGKSDESKVFDHFLKYHMKMLLGVFNANVGERIFSSQVDRRVSIRMVMIMGL